MLVLSHVQLFATPWTEACQAPLSVDSPGKNTGVGCHSLLQGIRGLNGFHIYTCNLHTHISHQLRIKRRAPTTALHEAVRGFRGACGNACPGRTGLHQTRGPWGWPAVSL